MKLFIFASVILLSACATTYQHQGLTGGFDEIKLAGDMYQVSFKGNGWTSSSTVQKYFLRRCAEITLTDNYDFFVFVDQNAETSTQNLGTTYNGTITPQYYGGYSQQGTFHTTTANRHARNGVIKLFRKGQQPQIALDAKQVLESLGVRVVENSRDTERNPAESK